MTLRWFRSEDLPARVARWTGAAALMGIVTFAGTMWAVLAIESGEADDAESEQAGEDLEEEAGEGILWAMLLAGPPSVALAIAGTVWASRRAFAPLHEVTRAAREITAADLGRRIELADTEGDLRELVVAFNELLERLDTSLATLDHYAGDVSHEIRTPLAVAITELEVALRQDRSSAQWQDQARRTLDDLRALASLTDSLLAMARCSTGAGMPRERVLVMDELVPLIEQARHEAARANIEFSLHGPEPGRDLVVAGSAPLLRGAVGNLLDNAIKHAGRPGRIAVTIWSEHGAEHGRLHIRVDDAGPGIPEHERERVFEPFARMATTDAAGFGIGLAIARRSVLAHGGSIGVTSSAELGGASFSIELPLVTRGPELTDS